MRWSITEKASNKYERLTEAFVAEDPYSTVITTLFSEKAQIKITVPKYSAQKRRP